MAEYLDLADYLLIAESVLARGLPNACSKGLLPVGAEHEQLPDAAGRTAEVVRRPLEHLHRAPDDRRLSVTGPRVS